MKNQPLDHLTPETRNQVARECCRAGDTRPNLLCELVDTLVHDQVAKVDGPDAWSELELGFWSEADLAAQVLELAGASGS